MKKRGVIVAAALVLVAVSLYCFAFIRNTAATEEEMLSLIRREKQIPESYSLHITGDYYNDAGQTRLLCIAAMNGCSTTQFYAVEFEDHWGRHQLSHEYRLVSRGVDEYILPWTKGYIFFSGNPANTGIRLSFSQGDVIIPVPQVPFSYFYDFGGNDDSVMEYEFLHQQGIGEGTQDLPG